MTKEVIEPVARQMIGRCRTTFFNKRRSGELPFRRDIASGRIFYKVSDLERVFGVEVTNVF
jgi:hypothetical protein